MATFPLDPAYRRVSVEEFLAMDFGGAKAELDDGIIFMMAGGSERHAAVAADVLVALSTRLRGSGCRAYGSDLAVRTGERSIRFPDVSIYCRRMESDDWTRQLIGDPQVIIEVLSPSTSSLDQTIKLEEYRALKGVREIVFVDPSSERVRVVARTGEQSWTDDWLDGGVDVPLVSLGITIPHAEIFTRD